jgi:septum formation protein
MRLILASSSPRRQDLLSQMGATFEIIKPDIDESTIEGESLLAHVERLSLEKAKAVVRILDNDPAVIISADTIVVLSADTIGIDEDGTLLEKPADADEARAMLKQLRHRAHQVHTAFTVYKTGTSPKIITQRVCTDVYMRNYSNKEIEQYIATGDPFDKAGSYAIQHKGFHPVEKIEGSYTNVVGFPVDEIKAVLDEIGWSN